MGKIKTKIIAVCGKGGVGKTSISALTVRALRDAGAGRILAIDADPAVGLATSGGSVGGTAVGSLTTAADVARSGVGRGVAAGTAGCPRQRPVQFRRRRRRRAILRSR